MYILKGEFKRRIGCQRERFVRRLGRKMPCRDTSLDKLLAAQRHELWRHLDHIGLTARVFSLRVQIYVRRHHVKLRLV